MARLACRRKEFEREEREVAEARRQQYEREEREVIEALVAAERKVQQDEDRRRIED